MAWDRDEFFILYEHRSDHAVCLFNGSFNGSKIKLQVSQGWAWDYIANSFATYNSEEGLLFFDTLARNCNTLCWYWIKNGRIHRENDLPAKIIEADYKNGPKKIRIIRCSWFLNGQENFVRTIEGPREEMLEYLP